MLIDSEWTTPVAKDERRNSKSVWVSWLIVAAAVGVVLVAAWGPFRDSVFVDAMGRPVYSPYYASVCEECHAGCWSATKNGVFVCDNGHKTRPDPSDVVIQGDGTIVNPPQTAPGRPSSKN